MFTLIMQVDLPPETLVECIAFLHELGPWVECHIISPISPFQDSESMPNTQKKNTIFRKTTTIFRPLKSPGPPTCRISDLLSLDDISWKIHDIFDDVLMVNISG